MVHCNTIIVVHNHVTIKLRRFPIIVHALACVNKFVISSLVNQTTLLQHWMYCITSTQKSNGFR